MEAFNIVALICTAKDSSHVVKFINLGIMELIKQRFQMHIASSSVDSAKICTNAAFALSNIVADADGSPHFAVLQTRLFEEALIPMLSLPDLDPTLRYEVITAVGNFFLQLDFDLLYYLLTGCDLIKCIVQGLKSSFTVDILLAFIFASHKILKLARRFKKKAQSMGVASAIVKGNEVMLAFEEHGGIDALEDL